MHCNLRPSDATPVLLHSNYDANAKFEVAQPICCRIIPFSLLIRYVLLRASILVLLIYLHTEQYSKELNYHKLPLNFMVWGTFTERFSGMRGPNSTKHGEDKE